MLTSPAPSPSASTVDSTGRTHARTPIIIILVADLDIRIIHAATGEILRDLTLDTTRDYQPTGAPKGPTRPKTKRTEPQ